jgi:hypothetical protein
MKSQAIDKIAFTLLLFAIVFMIATIHSIIVGELSVGSGMGVPTYEVIRYSDSPMQFMAIIGAIWLVVVALMTERWFALQHKK